MSAPVIVAAAPGGGIAPAGARGAAADPTGDPSAFPRVLAALSGDTRTAQPAGNAPGDHTPTTDAPNTRDAAGPHGTVRDGKAGRHSSAGKDKHADDAAAAVAGTLGIPAVVPGSPAAAGTAPSSGAGPVAGVTAAGSLPAAAGAPGQPAAAPNGTGTHGAGTTPTTGPHTAGALTAEPGAALADLTATITATATTAAGGSAAPGTATPGTATPGTATPGTSAPATATPGTAASNGPIAGATPGSPAAVPVLPLDVAGHGTDGVGTDGAGTDGAGKDAGKQTGADTPAGTQVSAAPADGSAMSATVNVPTPVAAQAPATPTAAPQSAYPGVLPDAQPELAAALTQLRTHSDGTHELSVQLHPADLGAVNVSATLQAGQLTVTVACATDAARAAVQAALPSLHHQLGQAGFGGVDVQFGAPSQGQPQSQAQAGQAQFGQHAHSGGHSGGPRSGTAHSGVSRHAGDAAQPAAGYVPRHLRAGVGALDRLL